MCGKSPAAAVLAAMALLAGSCVRMPAPASAPRFASPDGRWVSRTLAAMSVEEKVGQMVACRFAGDFRNLDSEYVRKLEELVVRSRVGGLILFGGEVYETAALINHFQKLAQVPLLIASDFERGTGNQVTNATLFPPLMALGAAGSEELAFAMGRITADEGRAMGVHMAYAPVADVNVNPGNPIINTRSVGEDPDLVGRMAAAFIRGCQEHGMIATAKHFPGHGDTNQDSHTLLPTIGAPIERLRAVELAPFRRAVEAGVRAIMTSHLFVPALDPTPGLPATLSAPILTGLLRKEMGFRGLIVTDAMEMAGVTSLYAPEEAALKAIQAGVDMVLLPLEPARVIDSLAAAVRDGKIPAGRIEESVRRILEAKAGLGLQRKRFVDLEGLARTVATRASQEQAYRTFERSATLVKNDGGVVPLARADKSVAVLSLSSDPGDYFAGRTFLEEMKKRNPAVAGFFADADTGREGLEESLAAASSAETVVLALFSRLGAGKGSVDLEPKHVELIGKLTSLGNGPAVVAVSFGSPYFLRHFPGVEAYLCMYRNTPETQEIAARALFGEMAVAGRLPVSLPGLYPVGHGLNLSKKAE